MEKIEGMISDIVFKNEDNGYVIAHLSNENNDVVIVGCMPTLTVGESIEVEGKWVNHKTYGTQFEVSSFMPVTPSSIEGIYVYLSSGMIKGIGEKMAKRIIDKFGVDTLDIIQNSPHRLSEVEGIGSKKIEQIAKSYEDNRELRNIIMQLSPYGITPNLCLKIYKKYKNKAVDVISRNPYKLAEDVRGIGFKVADKIAENLGIDKLSKDRIMQGILYSLNQSLASGHTYLPKDILVQESSKLLGVEKEYILDCILGLAYDQKIHIEKGLGHEDHIYLIPYYLSENGVCKQIIKLAQSDFKDLNIDVEKEIEKVEEETGIKLANNQALAVKE
ncbi:ATP-dependent RecD-like DNA helicase, partial [Turicibacter sanguinis]|nr:ATP-dependent RecD-like DNA helicase [Turicibacter sanguinis]